ncbi:hypothetical protein ACWC2T_37890 [Streptomyces sp. NPDC001393]
MYAATRVSRRVQASPRGAHRALDDADALAARRVPAGTRMALDNLAGLVEGPHARRPTEAE